MAVLIQSSADGAVLGHDLEHGIDRYESLDESGPFATPNHNKLSSHTIKFGPKSRSRDRSMRGGRVRVRGAHANGEIDGDSVGRRPKRIAVATAT